MITIEDISNTFPTGECYMTLVIKGNRNSNISYRLEDLPIAPHVYDEILRAKEVVFQAEDNDIAFRPS